MSYMSQLQMLIRGLEAGAIEPDVAIQSLMQLDADRKQRRQEKRQGLFDTLSQTALAGAESGMGLDSLAPILSAQQAFSGVNFGPRLERRLGEGLDSLFGPDGQSLIAAPSESTLWDTSPQLDVADRNAIEDLVRQGGSVNNIRAEIHSQFESDPAYDYNEDLQKSIDLLIQKALSQ